MSGCLGIFIGEKIVKYAKLASDAQGRVSIGKTGVKFINRDKFETVREVLNEVNQENLPISINLLSESYENITLINKLSKADMAKVINIEYEDICEKKGVKPDDFEKRYTITGEDTENEAINVTLVRERKQTLDKIKESLPGANLAGLIPQRITLKNLVPPSEGNYIIVNLEEQTQVITVVKGRIKKNTFITLGIGNILEALSENLNSYTKAYEVCKAMNVYGENTGNVPIECERIAEPIIQDMIHRIESHILESRKDISKIYITGVGTMFSNIDLLFKEYFNIETTLLKPHFIDERANLANLGEILEVNSAISLAYEYLHPIYKDLNFAKGKTVSEKISAMFTPKKKEEKKLISTVNMTEEERELAKTRENLQKDIKKSKKTFTIEAANIDKVTSTISKINIIASCALVTYLAIGVFFDMQIVSSQSDFLEKSKEINEITRKINDDIKYVESQTKQYEEVNNYVSTTIEQINNKEIGKLSTYNVAHFMQSIMSIIPANVNLETLSSDDNKHVTMNVKSTTYNELGYFISKLKLEGTLNNIKINKITHGAEIQVEIGGDLP